MNINKSYTITFTNSNTYTITSTNTKTNTNYPLIEICMNKEFAKNHCQRMFDKFGVFWISYS